MTCTLKPRAPSIITWLPGEPAPTQPTQTHLTIPIYSTSPVILDKTRIQAIETLDSWNFEPSKLPEEEVLVCTIILFEALLCKEGMEDEINVSLCRPPSDSSSIGDENSTLESQLSSRPSYPISVKFTDVRTRTTTFVTP